MSRRVDHPIAALVLDIPSRLYGRAMAVRNRYYDRPSAVQRVSVPVVSVGNITVGGTGKTPMVDWICRFLLQRGRIPAIVSRGYGGSAGKGPLVVSEGQGPTVSWEASGDEPSLLARRLTGVSIVVGSDRVAGAHRAIALGADVVVLDDGFQHRRLHRDLDLLLLDSSDPFGGYRMLPAGRLREPVTGLRRADLVILTRTRPGERFDVIERVIRVHNPASPIVHAGHRGLGFYRDGVKVVTPARVVAFCAIGNPSRFRTELEAQGIELVGFRTFRDHHRFEPGELAELAKTARSKNAPLLTTEKDLIRISDTSGGLAESPIVYRIAADVYDSDPLEAAIDQLLATEP